MILPLDKDIGVTAYLYDRVCTMNESLNLLNLLTNSRYSTHYFSRT